MSKGDLSETIVLSNGKEIPVTLQQKEMANKWRGIVGEKTFDMVFEKMIGLTTGDKSLDLKGVSDDMSNEMLLMKASRLVEQARPLFTPKNNTKKEDLSEEAKSVREAIRKKREKGKMQEESVASETKDWSEKMKDAEQEICQVMKDQGTLIDQIISKTSEISKGSTDEQGNDSSGSEAESDGPITDLLKLEDLNIVLERTTDDEEDEIIEYGELLSD